MDDLTIFVWDLLDAVDLEYKGEMYNLVEYSDWVASCKTEERHIIVMKPDRKYYRIIQSRTGSPFSD